MRFLLRALPDIARLIARLVGDPRLPRAAKVALAAAAVYLISPFDLLDTPPPHIIRGRAALKAFFHKYVGWQGAINVESLYDFAETEDAISFQAVFTSHTGKWVVGDAWYMKEKQIAYHFSFAHKIGEPTS